MGIKNSELSNFQISVEEFDAITEKHTFSDKYNKRKSEILDEYKRRKIMGSQKVAKAAAIMAAMMITVPVGVNAATGGDLFQRIWGNAGKENVSQHMVMETEEAKGTSYEVTYPEIEYAQVDDAKAMELIGNQISFEPVEVQMGDTTIKISSVVWDGNGIVAEYTLHRDGGVNCFNYSQLTNEGKGAVLNESVPFNFCFNEGSGKIFVDQAKSTEDTLYCYEYMVDNFSSLESATSELGITPIEDHITLWVQEYAGPAIEVSDHDDSYITSTREIKVPVKDKVATTTFTSASGKNAEVSPLAMKVFSDCEEVAMDVTYFVAITYKDGSQYTVMEREIPGIHDCATEKASYQYTCGTIDNNLIFLFNRLVDTDQIESIQVNDTVYTR